MVFLLTPNNLLLGLLFLSSVFFNVLVNEFYSRRSKPEEIVFEMPVIGDDKHAPVLSKSFNILVVPPEGSPPNLPALERNGDIIENEKKIQNFRKTFGYGGEGDEKHLGGFTEVDRHGISPALWKRMIDYFGVKSILDVGCGRGISTTWFHMQGVKAQCVEGSKDALKQNLLKKLVSEGGGNPSEYLVEHDYSRGPWWPAQTVDAVWAVEFLEHVSRHYQTNYLATFKKAAFIFATHSNFGGWHHTEVHKTDWWISRFEMYGFIYSDILTMDARQVVKRENKEKVPFPAGGVYYAQHLENTLMVFINPAVASRPEHAHLLAEPGCYNGPKQDNVQCGEEKFIESNLVSTPLPDEFKPIPFKEEKHAEWEAMLAANVNKSKSK